MRFPAITMWRATAAALAAFAIGACLPAQAGPLPTLAQAAADDDGATAPAPAAETPAPEERAEEPAAPGGKPIEYGGRRRLDPFDANREEPAAAQAPQPAVNPDDEVITCVAGCGSPGDVSVYRKSKQAAGR